ncbi:uncharacterized protein LOC115770826 [Drosophila novamexicana]|uniref:uncharacterized protein LOC115770826 n=1 Tax=Drosophila novamexicana TaxID=47314 RepID=UPI0011E5AE25|nr:uncharacterized protein LOC115770826 [Drosophila novamexicana]
MAAHQLNILDLNDYCLGRILKYLEIEDHVNFGQACTRFREALRDWSYVLYPVFEIRRSEDIKLQLKLFFIVCDVVKKLFLDIGESTLQGGFPVDQFCNHVQSMDSLECFIINEGTGLGRMFKTANSVRDRIIEKTFKALEHLPKLKSISVTCGANSYDASCLIQMKCLQELSLNTKIAAEDLVEICKSNANLRVLWLREVVGELNDIVPHCQNLEEIVFPMFSSHTTYAGLAELPNIKKIVIKSTNSTSPCAKLIELFSAFAAQRQNTQLQSLILLSSLNFEETTKLIELKFLKELRCSFEDASCIDLLTDLTELEGLYIMLGRSGAGSKECLNVLKSCKILQRLHINSNLSTDFVDKALEVLRKVRNTEKQKPLQLYSTGVMHLCEEGEEKLVDNAYCSIVNHSEYLRPLPWRLSI